jgi:hypothetical protein
MKEIIRIFVGLFVLGAFLDWITSYDTQVVYLDLRKEAVILLAALLVGLIVLGQWLVEWLTRPPKGSEVPDIF